MRADEPIIVSLPTTSYYINQLRYERLMAKARHFNSVDYHRYDGNKDFYDFTITTLRIAEAYEARARRIKEGM